MMVRSRQDNAIVHWLSRCGFPIVTGEAFDPAAGHFLVDRVGGCGTASAGSGPRSDGGVDAQIGTSRV
jgi:hypothetical protein